MSSSQPLPLDPDRKPRPLRPILLGSIAVAIILQIVALSPSRLEEEQASSAPIDPETLVEKDVTLATGIPKDRIPDYSVDQFDYVSTENGEKQWKLLANKAFMFNESKLVHARTIKALLFDPEGKTTVVTGREAKYMMNDKDLEIFGDVNTLFPDGFQMKSEYLRYKPGEKMILIPPQYAVRGGGAEQDGQIMSFESNGLDFAMAKSMIVLPQNAKLAFEKKGADSPAGVRERTQVESDRCEIDRRRRVAHFTMFSSRPHDKRFVKVKQPTLDIKARKVDMQYGEGGGEDFIHYMEAFQDVLIRETGSSSSLKYATGGRANFDSRNDRIVLTELPQVYQDEDTVTGDIIILHRDTDIVEIEHSNAFSSGK